MCVVFDFENSAGAKWYIVVATSLAMAQANPHVYSCQAREAVGLIVPIFFHKRIEERHAQFLSLFRRCVKSEHSAGTCKAEFRCGVGIQKVLNTVFDVYLSVNGSGKQAENKEGVEFFHIKNFCVNKINYLLNVVFLTYF